MFRTELSATSTYWLRNSRNLALLTLVATSASCREQEPLTPTPPLSGISAIHPAPGRLSQSYLVTVLGVPYGAVESYAYAVNDAGTSVGYISDALGLPHAVIWAPDGTPDTLPNPQSDPVLSDAKGINASGSITGTIVDNIVGAQAYRVVGATLTRLPSLPGGQSLGRAINAVGDVVGQSYDVVSASYHAVFWPAGGGVFDLGPCPNGGGGSFATAVNDKGLVVGECQVGGANQAFWWTLASGMHLVPLAAGEVASSATAVDNSGTIAGDVSGNTAEVILWDTLGGHLSLGLVATDVVTGLTDNGLMVLRRGLTWTSSGGEVGLPVAQGSGNLQAYGASPSGLVVGVSALPGPTGQFLWQATIWRPNGNQSPSAQVGGPYAGSTSAPIAFDGSASSDPDGSVVSFDWDFGDGSPHGSGATPSHTFSSAGVYTVTLTVTDNGGATGTANTTAIISASNHAPSSQPGGPYAGNEGSAITMSGAGSTDPDSDPLTYDWDFGDGSTHGSGVAPSHTYADNGSYAVTLTVSDGSITNSASATAVIANVAPTATFTNSAGGTAVAEGSPFTLGLAGVVDPSAIDASAGFSYAFDCGSGLGAFGPSSSISCPTIDNGPKTVGAIVRDKDGGVTSYAGTARVANVAPTVAITAASPRPVPRGGTFSINATFTDPGTMDNPWTVTINWGNGSQSTTTAVQGIAVVRSRAYPTAGTYSVRVTVRDKNGAVGTSNALTVRVQ